MPLRVRLSDWLASIATSDDPSKNCRRGDHCDVYNKSAVSILARFGQLAPPLHTIRIGSISPVAHRLKALQLFTVHACIEQSGQFEHSLDKLLTWILRVNESIWIERQALSAIGPELCN